MTFTFKVKFRKLREPEIVKLWVPDGQGPNHATSAMLTHYIRQDREVENWELVK